MKLGQFIKYYIKTFFMGKYVENVQHKLVLDLYLVLENYLKYSQCMQETLLQLSYWEKIIKKLLFSNPVSFHEHYKNFYNYLPVSFQVANYIYKVYISTDSSPNQILCFTSKSFLSRKEHLRQNKKYLSQFLMAFFWWNIKKADTSFDFSLCVCLVVHGHVFLTQSLD